MTLNLMLHNTALAPEYLEQTLRRCNEQSKASGLVLKKEDVVGLLKHRNETLQEVGRVEFSSGPLVELVAAFHDSPFFAQENYAESLAELQTAFYHLKESSNELITDDDLIDAMRIYSDEKQGTVDFYDENVAAELTRIAGDLGKDENEDLSDEESFGFDKKTVDPVPKAKHSEVDRINEGGIHNRPDNEYANSFYEEFNEIYRSGWDFNSRIGGSSL